FMSCGHTSVGNDNGSSQLKILLYLPKHRDESLFIQHVSWMKSICNGDAICIHKEPHLNDWVRSMFFRNPLSPHSILFIYFKIIICHIIVDQAGITIILFLYLFVHPKL